MGMGRRKIYRVKAADESVNNSDVLQDDNDLTCQVQAGTTYAVRMLLRVDGTVNYVDAALSMPAGATFFGDLRGDGVSAQTVATEWDGSTQIGIDTGACAVVGFLKVGSTAGTVKLQWAQNAATVGNTTLKAGSYMILERLN